MIAVIILCCVMMVVVYKKLQDESDILRYACYLGLLMAIVLAAMNMAGLVR